MGALHFEFWEMGRRAGPAREGDVRCQQLALPASEDNTRSMVRILLSSMW